MNELNPNMGPNVNIKDLEVGGSYPLAHQQELKEKITIVVKSIKSERHYEDGHFLLPASEKKWNVKVASKEGVILDLGELKAVSRSWGDVVKETLLVSSTPLIALGIIWAVSWVPGVIFVAVVATPFLLAAVPVVATGMIAAEIGKGAFYRLSNDQKKIEIGGKEYFVSGKEFQRFLDTMSPEDGDLPDNADLAEGLENAPLTGDKKVKTNEFQLLIKTKTITYLDQVFHNAAQSPAELNEKLKKALENKDQETAKELFLLGADPNKWVTVENKATGMVITGGLYTHAYVNGWGELRGLLNEAEHVRDKTFLQSRCFKQTIPDINSNSPVITEEMPVSGFSDGSDVYLQRIASAVSSDDPKKIEEVLSEYMALQKALFLAKMQEFRNGHPGVDIKGFREGIIKRQRQEAHELFTKRFACKTGDDKYLSTNLYSVISDRSNSGRAKGKWRPMQDFRSKFYKSFQVGMFNSNYLSHPYHHRVIDKKDYESFVHQNGKMDERQQKIVSCFVNPVPSGGAKDFLNYIKGINTDELESLLDAETTIAALRNVVDLKPVKEAIQAGNHTIFDTDVSRVEGEKGSLYAHIVKRLRDPDTRTHWWPIYEELHKRGLNRIGPFELTSQTMQYSQFPEGE